VFPGGNSISRKTLTYVIVACDMAICVLFVLNAVWIHQWTLKEERELDVETVSLTDFTVRIQNLPEKDDYGSIDELRAMLYDHITKIIKA
jgi:hypothetical protein